MLSSEDRAETDNDRLLLAADLIENNKPFDELAVASLLRRAATTAKSEPVTIDRDFLIAEFREVREFIRNEAPHKPTLDRLDAVIAHLAVQPRSFTSDEIHDAGMDARHAVDWRSYGLGGDDEAAQDISHAITERAAQSLAAQPVTGTALQEHNVKLITEFMEQPEFKAMLDGVKAEARAETIQAVRGASEFERPDPDDPSDEGAVYLTPSKLNALERSVDGMDWVRITATDFVDRLDEAAANALESAANWLNNGEMAGIIAFDGPSNRAEVVAAYDQAIEDPEQWLRERAATTRTPGEEK